MPHDSAVHQSMHQTGSPRRATSLGRIQMETATRSIHPTWLQHKTGLFVHSRRSWSITLSGNILLSTCQETKKKLSDAQKEWICHLRKSSPTKGNIFLCHAQLICLSTRIPMQKNFARLTNMKPKQQTHSKRTETSKHPNSAISRHVHVAAKKKVATVVFAVSTWPSLWKTSEQQVFVDTKGDIDNMLNLVDIPTANKRVHNQFLGTSHQRCEQLGWRVEDKLMNFPTKNEAREQRYSRYEGWERRGAPNTVMDNDSTDVRRARLQMTGCFDNKTKVLRQHRTNTHLLRSSFRAKVG